MVSANYVSTSRRQFMKPEEALVDRASAADADGPGDDRSRRWPARAEGGRPKHGVFTSRPEALTNDFFVKPARYGHAVVTHRRRRRRIEAATARRALRGGTGTRVDLIFGSHSQLRAFAEVRPVLTPGRRFVKDFVAAGTRS